MTFGKGEILLGNQSKPDGVYYISSGFVKIYSISDTGDEYLRIIYGHGEVFPLIWAYLGVEPEALFYEALSTCTVWRISQDWFKRFVIGDAQTSYAFGLQLAQQFSIFSDRVENLEYKKAGERVIYRLLFLANRFGVKHQNEYEIDAPLTHETFASSINLTRESVSREMEKLEQAGMVKKTNSHIIIKNIDALAGRLSRPANINTWQF